MEYNIFVDNVGW